MDYSQEVSYLFFHNPIKTGNKMMHACVNPSTNNKFLHTHYIFIHSQYFILALMVSKYVQCVVKFSPAKLYETLCVGLTSSQEVL